LFLALITTLAMVTAPPADGGMFTLKGHRVMAEVARSERERDRALSFRTMFKAERCMFMVMPTEGAHPIEMKRFHLAFDVLWLDQEGVVVELHERVPPCKDGVNCPPHGGHKDSKFVVFLQAGTIRRWAAKTGDKAEWDLHFTDGTNLLNGPDVPDHVHPNPGNLVRRLPPKK